MPSVFTIQGPELPSRARKRSRSRLRGASDDAVYCVWIKSKPSSRWKVKRCKRGPSGTTKETLRADARDLKKRGVAHATRVLPKGSKPKGSRGSSATSWGMKSKRR